MSAVEGAVIRELKEQLIASKHSLLAKYKQHDTDDTGSALFLSVTEMCLKTVAWHELNIVIKQIQYAVVFKDGQKAKCVVYVEVGLRFRKMFV